VHYDVEAGARPDVGLLHVFPRWVGRGGTSSRLAEAGFRVVVPDHAANTKPDSRALTTSPRSPATSLPGLIASLVAGPMRYRAARLGRHRRLASRTPRYPRVLAGSRCSTVRNPFTCAPRCGGRAAEASWYCAGSALPSAGACWRKRQNGGGVSAGAQGATRSPACPDDELFDRFGRTSSSRCGERLWSTGTPLRPPRF